MFFEHQLDVADILAVLLVEQAQVAAVEEDDIVFRRDGLALARFALFGTAREIRVAVKGADFLAVRSVHVQRERPFVGAAAVCGQC